MDNILNEMGDKWGTLNKAQQTALAQTVAGVRQYNQLISLMDNWDKGDSDSFQANLKTVEKAEGALDEQADIYAESWEAASDRVRAAAEVIYSNLINDEFFIDLLDFGADALTTIDKIMDSLGGMPGILSVISAIILKTFRGKIVDEIEGMTSALVGLADMEGAKAKS
jgi:TP901 family phage tail tape measure protein